MRHPAPAAAMSSCPQLFDPSELARQTAGDRRLERELFELFKSQAPALVAQILALAPRKPQRLYELAHQLKGSALALGAFQLAAAAAALEDTLARRYLSDPCRNAASGIDDDFETTLADLSAALARSLAAIDRYMNARAMTTPERPG